MTGLALRSELRAARRVFAKSLSEVLMKQLRVLLNNYGFSIREGDLQIVQGHWYVTHKGLLGVASRRRCRGIHSEPISAFCDPNSSRWAFKAVVYKSTACKGFEGCGDADPSNVSPLVRGAELRVAETRAVNRALRKAYGIGLCSVEEIGSTPRASESDHPGVKMAPQQTDGNGTRNGNGGPRVRDRLIQLIRQHQLDPDLVKAYAVDFCGTKTLKDATRAQVENFVDHLADWAAKDRDALLCQLNSYPSEKGEAGEKAGAA
jgi:hypothetical protein